ncbi:MAG: glycerol-3-phosphate acyltransferase [Enterococcaceae bacterium]|jgi:glycerol-3-phosphate acyltransferase PlsY|nr:glycerol-3-phosphate acyltransferase [Enterococcaceae bacterium]MCI1919731.1 glycerol-3-phosphate acyltransferase [Enterococcaceae bacterium]
MLARVLTILIGYIFGCFLTGEVVSKFLSGKSAETIGSGNPGAANVGAQFGKKWGVVVFLGDAVKTIIPALLCRFIFFPEIGQIALLLAGVGVVIGHDFPFWKKFQGGKGVAATCVAIVLFSPFWGLLACALGGIVLLLRHSLHEAGIAIPAFFTVFALLRFGAEPAFLGVFLTYLMIVRSRKEPANAEKTTSIKNP